MKKLLKSKVFLLVLTIAFVCCGAVAAAGAAGDIVASDKTATVTATIEETATDGVYGLTVSADAFAENTVTELSVVFSVDTDVITPMTKRGVAVGNEYQKALENLKAVYNYTDIEKKDTTRLGSFFEQFHQIKTKNPHPLRVQI